MGICYSNNSQNTDLKIKIIYDNNEIAINLPKNFIVLNLKQYIYNNLILKICFIEEHDYFNLNINFLEKIEILINNNSYSDYIVLDNIDKNKEEILEIQIINKYHTFLDLALDIKQNFSKIIPISKSKDILKLQLNEYLEHQSVIDNEKFINKNPDLFLTIMSYLNFWSDSVTINISNSKYKPKYYFIWLPTNNKYS
jgi:hypothetical protein